MDFGNLPDSLQLGLGVYAFGNIARRWTNTRNGRFVSEAQVIAGLRNHQQASERELLALTDRLYDGNMTIQQWQLSVANALKDGHLAQSMFAVGGKRNMTQANYGRVGGVLRDEYGYLTQFAQDIADGKQSRAQALARVAQYGRATQQSYWREYRETSEGLIDWHLGATERHCGVCPELAAASPHKPSELKNVPGDGQTPCRGNCDCTLSRRAA